ncbi:aquaporin-9-like isoform X2 [Daphnia carinata]|uniref:aquaporin-9-like isoform X1 n=1 Tax=Daphnia carinata TaxID=120202 RepID=UPI00257B9E23|nr:aquaporin-9-like isoform X1 [Daphnia carinata]XP_057371000.1 aquaporin-9-like isoform X2 [Daphnia carinata]
MRPRFCIPLMVRAAFAEFVGTYVLVVIGNGSVAQAQLTHGQKGDYFAVNWGWALGCMLGILVSANVSGGHLNPAVTLALAITRKFKWKKLPIYWLAQYLGALAASATVLGVYYEAIMEGRVNGEFRIQKNPADPGTAAIFANYPAPYSSSGLCLVEEIVATMIFMLVICATTDKRYSKVPAFLQPFYIGFGLLSMGLSYGANSGYALNPARDLGPRITSYLGGWGSGVFSFRDYNGFWIFIAGPHIGAILGVCIFELLIKLRPSDKTDLMKVEHEEQIQRKEQERLEIELSNVKAIREEYHASPVVELPRIGLRW